jgi:15-cis-phytoene synthase
VANTRPQSLPDLGRAGGGMTPDIAASYRCAEAVARRRARNFYYSFVVLPAEKRRALCAVYAFMRYCDDISDGSGSTEDKRSRLQAWRSQLGAAVRGEYDAAPILPAFHDSIRRYAIPPDCFHWVIDGAEMDLAIDRYQTFEDLYGYCFKVASAVGLVCLQIFGYTDERAKEHAEHCGIAFQLTNILRDIKEDAGMGRIYLPAEDLARFQYPPEDLHRGVADQRFLDLMAFETGRARHYFKQARNLLPLVDADSRPALWAMIAIYERLLEKIIRRPLEVFGPGIGLARREKAAIALRALAMRFL